MEIEALREFFKWCTIINGGLFLFWMVFLMGAPDLVYRIQTRFFKMSRETFDVVIYCFVGVFKLMFIFLNLVPYLVLVVLS